MTTICRNVSKRAKTTRHEKEKAYMDQLRCAGTSVAEYVGNGQGEKECADVVETLEADLAVSDVAVDDHYDHDQTSDHICDDSSLLLFIYDCETTGLGIYTEHITEIAAKVVGIPVSQVSQPTFSSLVKTSRNISKKGIHVHDIEM